MPSFWWDVAAVNKFRTVAASFVHLMEQHAQYSALDLLHAAHSQLPRLYLAALLLPVKPEAAFEEEPDETPESEVARKRLDVHQARWRPLFRELGAQLGTTWNSYQEIFDPYADPAESPVTGSLADDLSDIYCDLKLGEDHWAAGEFDAAVWEWQFGFESHWGEHATGALRAIRSLAADHGLDFPNSAAVDV
jgi:hypothetical protein